jgi:hypothetical protein
MPLSDRGSERLELAIETERCMWSAESYGELRRGSIGGEAVVVKSIAGCMRRLHSESGGESGVPTTEAGGDCMSGGNASRSGV